MMVEPNISHYDIVRLRHMANVHYVAADGRRVYPQDNDFILARALVAVLDAIEAANRQEEDDG